MAKLIASKLRTRKSRALFKATGHLAASAVSHLAAAFEKTVEKIEADLYIGHNIDTLLPLARLAQRRKAALIFDSMEYHADMGEGQTETEREIVKAVQAECLSKCDLVLSSSPNLRPRSKPPIRYGEFFPFTTFRRGTQRLTQ